MPDREPVARESANLAEEQREMLRELFPEGFTEGKVNFEKLRATLGDFVEERPYHPRPHLPARLRKNRPLHLPGCGVG
jgi:hypothetical protein